MVATSCFSTTRTATRTCISSWSIRKISNSAISRVRQYPCDAHAHGRTSSPTGLRSASTTGDPRWHDVYLLDLETGGRSLIWENRQEFLSVGLDWQLRPRHARSNAADGGARLLAPGRRESDALARCPPSKPVGPRGPCDSMSPESICTCFHPSTTTKAALVRVDWSTGEEHLLFASDRADVTAV